MKKKYKLIYPKSYIRRARSFIKKHPDLVGQYEKALKLLELNPNHPALNLHPLKGKLKNLHAVSINLSYRITLELIITKHEILLVNVGSHEEVYL